MTLILSPSDIEDVARLRDLRERGSAIRKEETEIRDRLLARLDGQDFAITASGAPALSVQHQVRRSVNAKMLEALYPETFDAVVEEKAVTVLKVDLEDDLTNMFPA
jgi:hypothetical protein